MHTRGEEFDNISQNSYFHRQLSHQTALPMQQFSSLNQWQPGSQEADNTNLFTMPPPPLPPLRPFGRTCQVGQKNHDPANTHLVSDIQTAACDFTHQSAESQIPLVSTLVFSDRDNKLIMCTAESQKQELSLR